MSEFVQLRINNMEVMVKEGTTILEAARKINITIPSLCYHDDLCVAGNCRVCVVEQKGIRALQASCCVPVSYGMDIFTNSAKVRKARKNIIALLLSEHNSDCLRCLKNGNCELQNLAREYAVDTNQYLNIMQKSVIDISSPSIHKDDSKCISCRRCVRTCSELQGVNVLTPAYKGSEMKISTFFHKPMYYTLCTNCGQCIIRCPTGALTERSYIEEVWRALENPDKHVIVQEAPAVRVGLGEAFGLDPGTRVTGKMVTALRRLGFDAVFDTNFSADLTIIEEGMELLLRLKKSITGQGDIHYAELPQFTSCSPGWIKYVEQEYPEILNHISTCKSPQQMFGALAKTYYAEKTGINPVDIVVVSIMPCTAKKFEARRPEMNSSGFQDVDYVLTTRELAKMIRQAGIDFKNLEKSDCDSLLGKHTGAAVIFGATGGVMEAALRTVYEIVTQKEVPYKNLNIIPVRGMDGVKEASIKFEGCVSEWKFLEGVEARIAIGHGLVNAKKLARQVLEKKSPYHFIEIMACPGGCLGGGGQPVPSNMNIRKLRMAAIYEEDESLPIRKSHENPEIKRIYNEFLTEGPCGKKSHDLLHTHYTERR